ncbi:MAG: hypothetical protein ACI9JN_002930, partial [Bacteroidia bacterium]
MKRIDDIFKNGLEGKGFEYTEQGWKDVENLMEDKPVGFIYRNRRLLLLFLVLLTFGIGFNVFNRIDSQQTIQQDEAFEKQWANKPTHHDIQKPSYDHDLISDNSVVITLTDTQVKANNVTQLRLTESFLAVQHASQIAIDTTPTPSTLSNTTINQNDKINYDASIDQIVALNVINPALYLTSNNNFSSWMDSMAAMDTITTQTSKPKKWKFYVGLNGSYINYRPKLTDIGVTGRTRKSVPSFGYGIRLVAKRNRWSFTSGVGMLRLKEKTNYEVDHKAWRHDTSLLVIKAYYGYTPSGNRIDLVRKITDSTLISTPTVDCPNCPVSFSYIIIPVDVGYSFGKKRLKVIVTAGTNVAILYKAKGRYLTDKSRIEDLSQTKALHPVLFQFNTSIGPTYDLTSKLNLQLIY